MCFIIFGTLSWFGELFLACLTFWVSERGAVRQKACESSDT